MLSPLALSPQILLRLAWRNLWRSYRRSLIMLVAIAVAVWAMIFLNAFMVGMVDEMVRGGVQLLPGHAQVHNSAWRNDPSVVNSFMPDAIDLDSVLRQPGVKGWAMRVKVPAVIASERDSRGVTLLGIDPATEARLGFIPHRIVAGRLLRDEHDRGIVLGARLVERLETRLGKRVVVMSQDSHNNVVDQGFRLVGIYQARLAATEEQYAYVGRNVLQTMLGMGDAVSEVAVLGRDYRHLEPWYAHLKAALNGVDVAGHRLEASTWMELDSFLATMLNFQDDMVFIFVGVIFLVLSFGLVNTIVMAVFERVREFGLMQALGLRPLNILLQVLLESLMLLCLGLALGNFAAWLTIAPLESGIDVSFVAEGLEFAGMGTVLYPSLLVEDMVRVSVLVVVLGLLASLLPAWRASRLDPIEALGKH